MDLLKFLYHVFLVGSTRIYGILVNDRLDVEGWILVLNESVV